MPHVKGQQHQKGSKALSKKESGNNGGREKEKSAGRSEKQKRKDRYAAEAGKKFKVKNPRGVSLPVGSNPIPSTVNVQRPEYICRCGQCLPCLQRAGMKERSGTFFHSLFFG